MSRFRAMCRAALEADGDSALDRLEEACNVKGYYLLNHAPLQQRQWLDRIFASVRSRSVRLFALRCWAEIIMGWKEEP